MARLTSYEVCILAGGTVKTVTVAQEREESRRFEKRKFPISCEAAAAVWRAGGMDLAYSWQARYEELATAWLALGSYGLLVQFDSVSVALLVGQTFIVGQDVLHQEARRLVHVDVVLGRTAVR